MKKILRSFFIFIMIFLLFINLGENITYSKTLNEPNSNYLTEKSILDHIKNTYKDKISDDEYIKKAENYLNTLNKTCDIYFALGYFEYISKNYNDAIQNFIKARDSINEASSDFIKIYTYIFFNKALIEENNHFGRYTGLIENAESAIKYVKESSVYKNDTYVISDILVTLTSVSFTRNSAIDLLNNYLKTTPGLTNKTKIALNYALANFYLLNFNYADAAYIYLDVINKVSNEPGLKNEEIYRIKSYIYLGNINFKLENYYSAIDFYNKAIDIPVKDEQENAKVKVGAYINIVDCYTNLGYYSSAKYESESIPDIIDNLNTEYKNDAEILFYNTLARLNIREENLKSANKNLNNCFELLKKETNPLTSNKDLFVGLTKSELLLAEGKYNEALTSYMSNLKESTKRGSILLVDIYEGIIKTYDALGNDKEALVYSKKLIEEEDKFQKEIDTDYISYTIKAYESEHLKEKQTTEQFWMILLLAVAIILSIIVITRIRLIKVLRESNYKDGMTKLFNRKYLDSYVQENKELIISTETSIILMDIDYFKNYNDNYGHVKGDEAIRSVSNAIIESIRKDDVAIRYGGEELVILLPKASKEEALEISKKIQVHLKYKSIEHYFSPVSNILTVSIGIYTKPKNILENLYDMINNADKALYEAKNTGKNKIVSFSKEI